jgi:SPP1 gp7 family putative phage head morphogenesis protein
MPSSVAVPADGYLLAAEGEIRYVGDNPEVAKLLAGRARLPASGTAYVELGSSGPTLHRPLENAAVDPSVAPLIKTDVAYLGGTHEEPVLVLKARSVLRSFDDPGWILPEDDDPLVVAVSKARPLDPTDPRDFDRITAALSSMIVRTAGVIERRQLNAWLLGIGFDWDTATDAQLLAASRALNRAMRKASSAVWIGIRGRIEAVSLSTGTRTRKSEIQRHDLEIGTKLKAPDMAAIRRAAKANAHYIRDYYGRVSEAGSEQMREIVNDGMKRGLGSTDIAKNIRRQLGERLGNVSQSYYNVVSNAVVNRSRSYSQLASYRDAGIEKYVFDAVLDEVTTNTCRALHNTEFEVSAGLRRFAAADRMPDPTDIKYEMPWTTERVIKSGEHQGKVGIFIPTRDGLTRMAVVERSAVGQKDQIGTFSNKMGPKALANRNLMVPPLHGRCRSTHLPVV